VATVSRALQKPDLVAPDTRRRVIEAVERLGYAPNAQARMLRTARSHTIVALVPNIANPFFAEIIRGIEQVAHRHHYAVLLGDTPYSRVREQVYADFLSTRQADGLITLMPHVPKVSFRGRPPIVNACEYVKDKSITSVYVDNVAAGREAVSYLLALGHRDIAFITGPMSSPICIDRDRGYEEALTAGGIKRDPALTVNGDFSVESGIRGVEICSRSADATAVFARTTRWRSSDSGDQVSRSQCARRRLSRRIRRHPVRALLGPAFDHDCAADGRPRPRGDEPVARDSESQRCACTQADPADAARSARLDRACAPLEALNDDRPRPDPGVPST
jgi:hypothetical protein